MTEDDRTQVCVTTGAQGSSGHSTNKHLKNQVEISIPSTSDVSQRLLDEMAQADFTDGGLAKSLLGNTRHHIEKQAAEKIL